MFLGGIILYNIRYIFVKSVVDGYVKIDLRDLSCTCLGDRAKFIEGCNVVQSNNESYSTFTSKDYDLFYKDNYIFITNKTDKMFESTIFKRGIFNSCYSLKSSSYRGIDAEQYLDICSINENQLMMCLYCKCYNNLYGDVNMVKRLCLDTANDVFKEVFSDKRWRDIKVLLNNG